MASQSLDEIYRFYMHNVYRYLFSLCRDVHLAEDLLQETFFRAYLHIEELHDEKVKPWLFRVAHHVFIDHHRREKRHVVKDELFFRQFTNDASAEKKASFLRSTS